MHLTFYGAARHVTGSCTLLEAAGLRVLIDCGLPQGSDEKECGSDLPFGADSIDFVLLTHAHIDHAGRLPLLAKEGFRGTVYATTATERLCSVMLADSAHIQESEAEWKSRKNLRSGQAAVDPLYNSDDAAAIMQDFMGVDYNSTVNLSADVSCRFVDAGHLLGSASIEVFVTEGGKTEKIVFSGDIGNLDQPIIKDPDYITSADYVVMESTYGNRLHDEQSDRGTLLDRAKILADMVNRTFKRGGNLIIPSFAVGRTQEILYLFRQIMDKKLLPYQIPVFVDSPLSVKATEIFASCMREDYFDEEAMQLIKRGINPIVFPSLVTIQDVEGSKALNNRKEPCVIISSSGMCEAGRIKHHLKHNLWRSECTVCFVGYQAGGTLGRSIVDGADHVTIFGEQIDIKAEITSLPGVSGHADMDGLIKWISSFKVKPKEVFINHGEESVAPYFAAYLVEKLGLRAYAPEFLETFDLAKELPEQGKAILVDQTKKTLEDAFGTLEAGRSGIASIIDRMEMAAGGIDLKDEKRCAKLANAILRLASDLEDLRVKWGSDVK